MSTMGSELAQALKRLDGHEIIHSASHVPDRDGAHLCMPLRVPTFSLVCIDK